MPNNRSNQKTVNVSKKSKAKDLLTIIKICIATGARWNEAESLQGKQLKNQSITYLKIKGKRNRTIPIDKALFDEIEIKKDIRSLRVTLFSAQQLSAQK